MFGFLFPSTAKRGKTNPAKKPARTKARRKAAPRSAPPPAPPRSLTVVGVDALLELRESARTCRYTLKVDAPRGLIQVVTPPGAPESEVSAFILRHLGWLKSRAAKLPAAVPFADGETVPLFGVPHVIRHDPTHRGGPKATDGVLTVGGGAEFVARRVRDYLIKSAREAITPRAHAHAAALGAKPAAISLRDTKSRWGSCSATGRLSFSWRLVLAPLWVLDYVVAHEAAHLREMNHSPRFWALCESLSPDVKAGRAWLKTQGAALFRYGAGAGG
jgi:predicted metal-dependent hydrolase